MSGIEPLHIAVQQALAEGAHEPEGCEKRHLRWGVKIIVICLAALALVAAAAWGRMEGLDGRLRMAEQQGSGVAANIASIQRTLERIETRVGGGRP